MFIGLLINLLNLNPFKTLFYTAVIYGLISPVLILFILLLANNAKVMGKYKNKAVTNVLGGFTLLLMSVAAVTFLVLTFY